MSKTRTRFAPSPTGYMHVGNLRTALYAYLKARQDGGTFILRIEDTDRERLVEGAVDIIYSTLKETGLTWDEGPDVGGPYAPYVQSERADCYIPLAEKLIEGGHAYRCFCTKERLEQQRAIQTAGGTAPMYDGHCRHLTKDEIDKNLAQGVPFVVRQLMPSSGDASFEDMVYGHIEVDASLLDDQILIKTDGMPTYNFANVVDDHEMGITHIIRGSEYLSSTPKYNLLYRAFGWDIPSYIHCPPVMKDATHKLSKRNGDASYEDLVAKGYLKDALVNYIALLGWGPKDEREIFTLEELIEAFDVAGISKSPAIFDYDKLRHINAEHIRALPFDDFCAIAVPIAKQTVKDDCDFALLCTLLQKRTELLSDITEQVDFIDELPQYNTDLYVSKKMKTTKEGCLETLKELLPILEAQQDYSHDALHGVVFEHIAKKEVKNGIVLWPLRVAVSGKQFTPGGGIELAAVIGKDKTIERIKEGIMLLSQQI